MRTVSFSEFWQMVANELGDARLLLNPKPSSINDFIASQSDIRTYLHQAIRFSYQRSHCQHLNSKLDFTALFDVLGETAYNLKQQQQGDLFDIELLEEILWLACDRYQTQTTEPETTTNLNPDPKADVLCLDKHKIRQANRKL